MYYGGTYLRNEKNRVYTQCAWTFKKLILSYPNYETI